MSETLPAICLLSERCCGCGACAAVCPKGCVGLASDALGFPRPEVDASACVGCGLCGQACPAISPRAEDSILDVRWASAVDADLLKSSSSGGVFGLLAAGVLADGGAVYGAAFAESCSRVRHVRVDRPDGLDAVMRSKYVQSTVAAEVYRSVGEDLRGGRRVLFSGTACQVAGLRNYLDVRRVPQESLLCVDVICHGVPSPKLWAAWLSLKSREAGLEIDVVNFRSKTSGWTSYSVLYKYRTEKDVASRSSSERFANDWYMKAFLSNASLRGSCLACPAKRRCGSDITLGDFWGVQRCRPEAFNEDCGVSAAIANTASGREALNSMQGLAKMGPCTYEEVVSGNPALVRSVQPHPRREEFLASVAAEVPVEHMVAKWDFGPTRMQRLKALPRRAVRKLVRALLGEERARRLKSRVKELLGRE